MIAARLAPRLLPTLLLLSSLAHADVSVPFARFYEQYAAAGVVYDPLWNDLRARPDLYAQRAIAYQVLVKGRIDSPSETRLIAYTTRDEAVTIVCPGGCAAAALGTWIGVIGGLTPEGNLLLAAAVTQIRPPQLHTTTSTTTAAPSGDTGSANGAAGVAQQPAGATAPTAPQSTAALTPRLPDGTAPLPAEGLKSRTTALPGGQPTAAQTATALAAAEANAIARLERFITTRNRRIDPAERRLIATEILRWSRYHGFRWEFFAAVIAAESDYNKRCVSSAGAMGLGQLMPFNCKDFGVSDPFDVRQNLAGSAAHLREFLDKYRDRDALTQFQLTLASYNAGPGAVRKYGGVPPYNETINYIKKIADLYVRLCNESAAAGG
ncbi:MAG: lytic transglycosylase domain-containing protein [Fimbriimonadaceae bacterium]|nr:lytic transglycosylase domain-containing protein [Fimbriimonadaceae bacterium]